MATNGFCPTCLELENHRASIRHHIDSDDRCGYLRRKFHAVENSCLADFHFDVERGGGVLSDPGSRHADRYSRGHVDRRAKRDAAEEPTDICAWGSHRENR